MLPSPGAAAQRLRLILGCPPSCPTGLSHFQRGPAGLLRLNPDFTYEETEAGTCGVSKGAPGEWAPLPGEDLGLKPPGEGRRTAPPFNDTEKEDHKNVLETEVLRSRPDFAPPHVVLE